jgi:hypothetical protein
MGTTDCSRNMHDFWYAGLNKYALDTQFSNKTHKQLKSDIFIEPLVYSAICSVMIEINTKNIELSLSLNIYRNININFGNTDCILFNPHFYYQSCGAPKLELRKCKTYCSSLKYLYTYLYLCAHVSCCNLLWFHVLNLGTYPSLQSVHWSLFYLNGTNLELKSYKIQI